jgi:hypothetical protein
MSPAPRAVEASPAQAVRQLRELVESGAIRLELDFHRLEHIDSPVVVEAESNRWIYALIALCIAAFFIGGWRVGLAAIAASLALYLTLGRADVRRRLTRRVHREALVDSTLWRNLWRFGGVVLVAAGDRRCAAPAGDWRAFLEGLDPPS